MKLFLLFTAVTAFTVPAPRTIKTQLNGKTLYDKIFEDHTVSRCRCRCSSFEGLTKVLVT